MAKAEGRRRRSVVELSTSETIVRNGAEEGTVRPRKRLRRTTEGEWGKNGDEVRGRAEKQPGHVIGLEGSEYDVLSSSLKYKKKEGGQAESTRRVSSSSQLPP